MVGGGGCLLSGRTGDEERKYCVKLLFLSDFLPDIYETHEERVGEVDGEMCVVFVCRRWLGATGSL